MSTVDGAGLANWNYQHVDHFLSINGWNPSTVWVAYADTADQWAPGSGSTIHTYGQFYKNENGFFNYAFNGSKSEKNLLW